jgi:hypothetical protein
VRLLVHKLVALVAPLVVHMLVRVVAELPWVQFLDSIEGTEPDPCTPWSHLYKSTFRNGCKRIRQANSDDRSIGQALELLLVHRD